MVSISENSLLLKPEDLSFSEAAGLPKSGLVAYGAVKAAGFLSLPVPKTAPGKMIRLGEEDVVASKEDPALLFRKGSENAITQHQQAKVALVGASTTIGLIILQMLTSRKVVVVGVSSSSSAHVVLSAGAVAVLDRNKGGLDTIKEEEINFDVVIDCVGGQVCISHYFEFSLFACFCFSDCAC